MGYEFEDEELFFGDAQTTTCIEKFSVKCQKEIGITLAQDWLYFPVGLDNQRHSCNQSEGNLINLLLIWYPVFYRYSCHQCVFTLRNEMKEIGITLAQDWLYFPVGLDNQRHSCNQSEGNLINLLLIWYPVFYRYSCHQCVFTLSSHWLFATCSFVLIGCCDYFGCRPTSLKVT